MTTQVNAEPKKYASMAEFYPFYLSEHSNRTSRRLHFVGTSLGLLWIATAIATLNAWFLLGGPGFGLCLCLGRAFLFREEPPGHVQLSVLQLRRRLGHVVRDPARQDQVLSPA